MEEEEVKLSEATLEKFKEVNEAVAEEEGLTEPTEEKPQFRDPRKDDPALNEEGEVVDEEGGEPEGPEEEKPEELEEEVEAEAKGEPEGKPEAKADELTLPSRLVQAGRREGLTDEDIVALGDRAETVLGKMADQVDQRSAEFGKMGRELKSARQEEPKPIEKSYEKKEDYLDEDDRFGQISQGINKLNERFGVLEQRDARRQKQDEQNQQRYIDATVDSFCDERSNDYPEFGEAKALTRAQHVIRDQLYNDAENILLGAQSKGQNIDLPSAMERAFSIYEGTNAKTTVRSKLVKEAQARQKQFTSRPTKRKTTEVFSNATEKAKASYAKKMVELGFRVPDDDEE